MADNDNLAKAGLMGVNAGAKIGGDLSATRLLTELPSNGVNTTRDYRMVAIRTDTNDPLDPSFDPGSNNGAVTGMVVASNTYAEPCQSNAIMSVGTTRDTAQGVAAQEQGNDFGIGLKACGRMLGEGPAFVAMKGLSGDGLVEIWGMVSTDQIGTTRGALVPKEAGNIAYCTFNAKVVVGARPHVEITYPKNPRSEEEVLGMFMLYASELPFSPCTYSGDSDLIEVASMGKASLAKTVEKLVAYGQRCRNDWQLTLMEKGFALDAIEAATDVCTLAWPHRMRPNILVKLPTSYDEHDNAGQCNSVVITSSKTPLATHLATTFSLDYYESVSNAVSLTLNGVDIYDANPRRPCEAIERTFKSTLGPKTEVEIYGKIRTNDGVVTDGRLGVLYMVPVEGATDNPSAFRGKTYINHMAVLQNKGIPYVLKENEELTGVDVEHDPKPMRASPGVAVRIGGAYLALPHVFHQDPDSESWIDKDAEAALTSRGTQALRTKGQWSGERVVRFTARMLGICSSDMSAPIEDVAAQLQAKLDVSDTPLKLMCPKLITALMALGCQLGDGAKIAHIDDDGVWDMGKLIKTKSKEMPAPTGGTKRTGFAYKFRTSTKECWFRLRRNEYGPTKEWVAVKTRPAAAAKPPKKKKKKTTTTTSTTATTN